MSFQTPHSRCTVVFVVLLLACCHEPLAAQSATQPDNCTTNFRVQLQDHTRRMVAQLGDTAPRYRLTEITTELTRTLEAPMPDGWVVISMDLDWVAGDVAALPGIARVRLLHGDTGGWAYKFAHNNASIFVTNPLPLRDILLRNAAILERECDVPRWVVYRCMQRWKKATDLALWRSVLRVHEILVAEDGGEQSDERTFEDAVLLRTLLDVSLSGLPFVLEVATEHAVVLVFTSSGHDLFEETEAMYYVFVDGKFAYQLEACAHGPRVAATSSLDSRRIGCEVRRMVLKKALELRRR